MEKYEYELETFKSKESAEKSINERAGLGWKPYRMCTEGYSGIDYYIILFRRSENKQDKENGPPPLP